MYLTNFYNCCPFITQIPQHYTCFCKKELTPASHLWLVPHSCGELCEKPLKSQHGLCSHNCMILCHPGPCPPCSQTIATSCECKKSNLRTIRCVQQSWKCGNKVGVCVCCYWKFYCVPVGNLNFYGKLVFEIACMWHTYMQRDMPHRMSAVYEEEPTAMPVRE